MKGLLSKDQISKLANHEKEQKRQQEQNRGRAGGNRRGRNNRD